MGAMDDYTHLNIEPLRPIADILATKWKAALALRRTELAAGKQSVGNCLNGLAERTGLEPATPGVTGRYSNRLNYRSVSC